MPRKYKVSKSQKRKNEIRDAKARNKAAKKKKENGSRTKEDKGYQYYKDSGPGFLGYYFNLNEEKSRFANKHIYIQNYLRAIKKDFPTLLKRVPGAKRRLNLSITPINEETGEATLSIIFNKHEEVITRSVKAKPNEDDFCFAGYKTVIISERTIPTGRVSIKVAPNGAFEYRKKDEIIPKDLEDLLGKLERVSGTVEFIYQKNNKTRAPQP